MKTKLLFLFLTILCIYSCEPIEISDRTVEGEVEGVRPIYAATNINNWDVITPLPAQPIQNLGKIYYKDNFIFVNERFRGIHIIDNNDPTNPIPVQFIEVLGNEDIAIKGNFLYADNMTDLVVLNISNLDNIQEVNRVKGLYPDVSANPFPEGFSGFFECVDESLGTVIGWEEATLLNPNCFR